ncbi:MAG: OmpA family protein [Microscillaceae bacterium]|nr:OmpA family protein [Microscillaceae bacterium]
MVKHIFIAFVMLQITISPAFSQKATLENLGNQVNSAYNELVPLITPDGKTIYFTRKGHPDNINRDSYDIWFSSIQANGAWGQAQNIGSPLNNEHDNFVTGVTPDGNTLVVSGYYKDGVYIPNLKGYSLTHKTQDGWSPPQGIDIEAYQEMDKGRFSNIWLASDNKTLLLSFSTKANDVDGDLYVSFLQENGIWSRPLSLGNDINSELDEGTPFLASDGLTLYFSSNRQGSLGQHDIYFSKRADETWQRWSLPQRLEAPINTPSWDAYYTVPASGDYAFIVSYNQSFGGSDIFKVKLKEEYRPDPVILVYGYVYDARTKEPLSANIAYDLLKDGTPVGKARSNPKDGSYKIVLKQGEEYGFRAESENYFAISEHLNLTQKADYKEIQKDLYLAPIQKGETIRLNNLFFDYAQSELRPTSYADLMRLVDLLEKNPTMRIEIQGHTDNIGDDQKNLLLSESRAKSCVDYLISKGIEVSRMHYQGFGETQPLAGNNTEEDRRKNRRVEFKIIEN